MSFGHLHAHTDYSLQDSILKVTDYIDNCKKRGIAATAITDHGNIDGALRFYEYATQNGIKPLLGCEMYVVDDHKIFDKDEKRLHVVVLAKNYEGFQKILKLLTIANREGFYKFPRISHDLLIERGKGDIIVLTACITGLLWDKNLESINKVKLSDYQKRIKKYHKAFSNDLYLEIMPHNSKSNRKIIKRAIKLHEDLGINIVLTNDVHYLNKEDSLTHEVLLTIRQKKKMIDTDRWKYDVDGLYLKTEKEMIKSFREIGVEDSIIKKGLKSISEIIDKCNISLEKQEVNLPLPYETDDEKELLIKKVYEGAKKRGLNIKDPIIKERLERELKIITKGLFSRYFLMVEDLVKWAKEEMLVGCGRGSASGSLASYCLGITQIDPMRFGLYFERFLSEDRIDLPDIDIDFQSDKRYLVEKYLENKYGKDNVAHVSNFMRMKAKMALRDVGRVYNIPIPEIDKVSEIIPDNDDDLNSSDGILNYTLNNYEEGKKFKEKYGEICKHACKLENIIRGKSTHAAGFIVANIPFEKFGNCVFQKNDKYDKIVNWDKRDLEFFGFCKLDVLGVSVLSIINEVIEKIGISKKQLDELILGELNDKNVFDLLNDGYTTGVFQFGTRGLTEFTKKMKCENFKDIYDATALFRPGTLRSGSADLYIRRKHGEKVKYLNKIHKNLTESAYGILIYQEQTIALLNKMAGIDLAVCDKVRKLIAKSQGTKAIEEYRGQFVDGCIKLNTLDEEKANKLFDTILESGNYQFNLAHAVGYSIISYITAYLKYYYPAEFLCACLNFKEQDYQKEMYINEVKRLGIQVEYPDINYSGKFWEVKEGKLYCGLKEIDFVGDSAIDAILFARGKVPFQNEEDFYKRLGGEIEVYKKTGEPKRDKDGDIKYKNMGPVTKRVITNLKKCNAFFNKSENTIDTVDSVFKFNFLFDEEENYTQFVNRSKKEIKEKINTLEEVYNKNALGKLGKETIIENGLTYGRVLRIKRKFSKEKQTKLGSLFITLSFKGIEISFSVSDSFYEKNKDFCEGLKDKYILVEFDKTYDEEKDKYYCRIKKIWEIDSFFEPNKSIPNDFPIKIRRRISKKKYEKLSIIRKDCRNCSPENCLYKANPVPIEIGKYNILIIGEAPGGNEDKLGKPFMGRAGGILWKELEKHGYDRNDFCVSNVLKCRPKDNKITKRGPVNKCGELWLNKEIDKLKPSLILVLGRTAMDFIGNKKSITEMCGKVEWDFVRKCLKVYCFHPSSLLYSDDNKKAFSLAINNFVRMVKRI